MNLPFTFSLKKNKGVELPDAPLIQGLSFRYFQGEMDFAEIAEVVNASHRQEDPSAKPASPQEIAQNYEHLEHCDFNKDLLFAEVNGKVAGYARVNWTDDEDGRMYVVRGNLRPDWRRKGIGRALLHWSERRLNQVAQKQTPKMPRFFQSSAESTEKGRLFLLESEQYKPVRTFYEMVHSDLDDLPEISIPEGLEVRPVRREQLPEILAAYDGAMRDHWNYTPMTEEEMQALLSDFKIDPSLWQVAWDEDQVAGMVISYIDAPEGEKNPRGITEPIAVCGPWRRRGLARSLLVKSLQELKTLGVSEAMLHVDMENPNGALRLYEGIGYRTVKESIIYRKPLPL